MEELCPNARIFNYTNPVNIVAQAVTHHTPVKIVSLCEGPINFAEEIARDGRARPRTPRTSHGRPQPRLVGRASTSTTGRTRSRYFREAWERRRDDPTLEPRRRRQLQLAAAMGPIPADYFKYYYFTDEILAELQGQADDARRGHPGGRRTTGATTRSRRSSDDPQLDPFRSRGGIQRAGAGDRRDGRGLQRPRRDAAGQHAEQGRALPGFPDDLVVEVLGRCHRGGIDALPAKPLPRHVRGLVEMLGEYQVLAAETGWSGDARRRRAGAQRQSARPLGGGRRARLRRARGRAPPLPARPAAAGLGLACARSFSVSTAATRRPSRWWPRRTAR